MNDLRYVTRSLLRSPAESSLALLVLAVGLASSVAVYTLVDQAVLRPLPYPDSERLVTLWSVHEELDADHRTAHGTAESWRQRLPSLEELGVADPTTFTVRGDQGSVRVPGAFVSSEVFTLLGSPIVSGRYFGPQEASRQEPVAVVSRDFAKQRFGDPTSAIGKSISINGNSLRVLGVVTNSLDFPSKEVEIWAPAWTAPAWDWARQRHGLDSWLVLARLRLGVSMDDAQRELNQLGQLLATERPAEYVGLGARIVPLAQYVTGRDARSVFWTLLASVLLLLGIGCANVAKLLLVRQQRRRADSRVRFSLGAAFGDVLRIPMIEAALLSVAAMGLALPASSILVRLVADRFPAAFRVAVQARPDGSLWIAVGALVFLTVFVSASLPVWTLVRTRPGLATGSRTTRGNGRMGRALLSFEASLALILVWAGTVFFQSVVQLRAEPLGFDPNERTLLNISLPRTMEAEQLTSFYESINRRLSEVDGVERVGAIEDLFSGSGFSLGFERADGVQGRLPAVTVDAVTPGFFSAVGTPILRGRDLANSDATGSKAVAVINQRLAHTLWPDSADVVGREFRLFLPDSDADDQPWITVVGIAADSRREAMGKPPLPQVFRPHSQRPSRNMNLIVAGALPTRDLEPQVRRFVAGVLPDAAVYGESTLAARLDRTIETQRMQSFLASAFSLLGLLIAALGIFGLTWQSVVDRSKELAIRLAVGATPSRLLGAVLGERLRDLTIGVVIGMGAIWWLEGLLAASVHGTALTDPGALLGATAILGVTGLAAAWLPARRAASLDPAGVLGSD